MHRLKLRGNQAVYKGIFVEPIFELLSSPETVRKKMYGVFHPSGFGVGDLRFDYNAAIVEQYVAVQFRRGHSKFLAERIEISLTDFTEEDIQQLPKMLETAEAFVKTVLPTMEFQNQEFSYYGHLDIEGGATPDFLSQLPAPVIKSAGNTLGTGFNFLWDMPDRKWRSRLVLDHSLIFPGALFIGLTIEIQQGRISYPVTLEEIRSYFAGVLAELDLVLPVE